MAHLLWLIGWRRLVVTGLCLVAWRALYEVTVPGLSPAFISARLQVADTSTLVHAIGAGSLFSAYSIVAMGVGPYVNALIVMSLLTAISPRVRAIGNGADGLLRLRLWTRALAVALALGQAYGWTVLMQLNQAFPHLEWFPQLVIALELTAGTMVLVFLADVIDEFGVGFGYGAILIFALTPLATELHRLADFLAYAPSVEALYRPLGVWIVFSIGLVVATSAVLLATRRVPPVEHKKGKSQKPVELKLLMSGVMRPPMFTQAVMFFPVIVANYFTASNPGLARWMTESWTPYGVNPWMDTFYVAVEVAFVIGFTFFVVALDFRTTGIPHYLSAHANRLTLVGGTFLAFAVAVVPVLDRFATRAAGTTIPISGFDAVLVVAVMLAIMGGLGVRGTSAAGLPLAVARLP